MNNTIKPKMDRIINATVSALFLSIIFSHFVDELAQIFYNQIEHYDSIWIDSPSGKHYKLSIKTALRIIRKRGWIMTKVEPVKTRWQHFKAAFTFRRVK